MQFVFAIVWTHWLTHADYGLLTFLIASQELLFLCCVSWWSLYVLRFFGGAGADESRSVLGIEPGILAITCVPQLVLNIVVLAELGALGDLQLVVASMAYVVGRSFVVYFSERVRTKADIAVYTIAQIGSLAAGGLLGFLLVALLRPTASSVLSGFAIAHLAVALWLVSRLGVGGIERKIDTALLKRAAAFGLPLVIAGVINWVNLNGIRVVVENMGGATAVGLLAVGWSLGQRLSTTAAMFVTMASFPLAARSLEGGERGIALRQLQNGGTLLIGLVLPAAAGLCLITPPFVRLLISEPFREITLAIMPLAVITGAVRNIRVHYADMAFILFDRTKLSVLVNAVEAAFMIALCAMGFAHAGIYGAVMGALVASSLGAALAFAIARPFGLPMPLTDWMRIAIATACMALVLRLVSGATESVSDLLAMTLSIASGAATYAVALVCLFPVRLRGLLRNALRHPAATQPTVLESVSGNL